MAVGLLVRGSTRLGLVLIESLKLPGSHQRAHRPAFTFSKLLMSAAAHCSLLRKVSSTILPYDSLIFPVSKPACENHPTRPLQQQALFQCDGKAVVEGQELA